MKLVDTNVLIYATDTSSPFHEPARSWWVAAVNDPEPIGLPWVVTLGCVRILTNPSAVSTPLSSVDALTIVETWLQWPQVQALSPKPGHLQRVRSLLHHAHVADNERVDLMVNDLHIAALALEHGATVYTCDRGFRRFTEIRHVNPLTPAGM